jgi:hypothetical protein
LYLGGRFLYSESIIIRDTNYFTGLAIFVLCQGQTPILSHPSHPRWFQMTGETLHEAGIAVPAPMSTPNIRVDTEIKTRDGCLGQNGLGKDLLYPHI